MPAQTPGRLKIALALLGLACAVASLAVAFRWPFGLWHWPLLLAAGVCLLGLRRVR